MKLTLVFCLLAIYGAVADGATGTTATTKTIGDRLQSIIDRTQAGIDAKHKVVKNTAEVVTTSITEGTKLAAQAIGDGTAIAHSAIKLGENMAVGGMDAITNINGAVMNLVDAMPVVNKIMPTNTIKGMFSKAIDMGKKVATGAASAGSSVLNKVGETGKNVMGGAASTSGKISQGVLDMDQKMNAMVSSAVTTSVNKMSGLMQGIGNKLMNMGSKISTSASMNTASTGTTASAVAPTP